MNTYLIFIVDENGMAHYYGKTPISAQVYAIKYKLEQQGKTVKIMKNGQWK